MVLVHTHNRHGSKPIVLITSGGSEHLSIYQQPQSSPEYPHGCSRDRQVNLPIFPLTDGIPHPDLKQPHPIAIFSHGAISTVLGAPPGPTPASRSNSSTKNCWSWVLEAQSSPQVRLSPRTYGATCTTPLLSESLSQTVNSSIGILILDPGQRFLFIHF